MAATGQTPEEVVQVLHSRVMNGSWTHPEPVSLAGGARRDEMEAFIEDYVYGYGNEWFWSLSPKLWSTAGEKHNKAIRPEVIREYASLSSRGQLKYVVNGSDESWREVEENTKLFRDAGCNYPVWIMGVGGTFEGLVRTEADIADEAIQRGYNYTSRVHVHIYGNAIGK